VAGRKRPNGGIFSLSGGFFCNPVGFSLHRHRFGKRSEHCTCADALHNEVVLIIIERHGFRDPGDRDRGDELELDFELRWRTRILHETSGPEHPREVSRPCRPDRVVRTVKC